MVKERVIYVCEFCQKEYLDLIGAEKCERICRRLADSPGLNILNLSPRTFNLLYYAEIITVSELVQLSEKELLKINGLGSGSLDEIKEKLRQYGVNLKVVPG